MNRIDVVAEVRAAEKRIYPHVRRTWLEPSPHFSELMRADVHFKLENLQHTGSFKARGAMNKVLALSDAERARGIVTASTGNHGAAVAFSLGRIGLSGIVFVPERASPAKVANIRRLGAEVRYHGLDSAETETFARRFAEEAGATFISPYNDPQVVGGQGTVAAELVDQSEGMDWVFVALGGGGLISGIAGLLKSVSPATRIVGCSPVNSQVMIQSVRAGRILDLPSTPTLSDGTAGGVEADAITFALVSDLVDDFVTVSETEIEQAMREFLLAQHMLLEGAAGVAIAGALERAGELEGQRVVIVICGANIALDTLRDVLTPAQSYATTK